MGPTVAGAGPTPARGREVLGIVASSREFGAPGAARHEESALPKEAAAAAGEKGRLASSRGASSLPWAKPSSATPRRRVPGAGSLRGQNGGEGQREPEACGASCRKGDGRGFLAPRPPSRSSGSFRPRARG